jgi:hypothetical protein
VTALVVSFSVLLSRPISRICAVALAFLILSVVMTWPVAARLDRSLPADLGDPLLNCWILAHGAGHWSRILTGDLHAWNELWNANIFYPAPLALAYSEHLTPQAIQVLPVWLVTHNPILCYNLLFLSTFFLSAIGMYLWTRELTGDGPSAFLAGALYAFALCRWTQLSHLQVLSAQWMPFVLLGLRRFFARGSDRWLWLAALLLIVQNLSCGYHLFFFMPFVGAYVVSEVLVRRAWREPRVIIRLVLASLLVLSGTLPFLLPYLQLRAQAVILRPDWEVASYSADVYSYLTAATGSRLWGSLLRAQPRPEGDLFPGIVPLSLTLVALVVEMRRAHRVASAPEYAPAGARRVLWRRVALAGVATVVGLWLAFGTLPAHGVHRPVDRLEHALQLYSLRASLCAALVALVVACALSERARRMLAVLWRSNALFFAAGTAVAALLSLGVRIRLGGLDLGPGPFALLHDGLPGYDSLRAPSRFVTEISLFLATLSGIGAAHLRGSGLHRSGFIVPAFLLVGLVETGIAPIAMDARIHGEAPRNLPTSLNRGPDPEGIYLDVAALPKDAVLVEFPFGDPPCELRYVYASIFHGRRIVNGLSGAVPERYRDYRTALGNPMRDPRRAIATLRYAGASHAIVHEGYWKARIRARRITRMLKKHGWREIRRDGQDVLLAAPAPIESR